MQGDETTLPLSNPREEVTDHWPVWAKVLMSLAVAYHSTAILAAAVGVSPSSAVERRIAGLFRNYYEIVNQGLGYRYYAKLDRTADPHIPMPWGTPVVFADVEFDDPGGSVRRETVRLPAQKRPWPRLRFQRQLDLGYHLSTDPRWAASIARHIIKSRGCSRVTISVREHHIPDLARTREAAARGDLASIDLDGESTYGPRVKLGEFRCTEF